MKSFLLDTNIPSELTRPSPSPRVREWLGSADEGRLYISVVTLGEIVYGISILPASKRRLGLQQWLDSTLRPWFGERVLPITAPIAERWGAISAESRTAGRQLKMADGLIAATAAEHDLTVVTRNQSDFEHLGIEILNPWE